MAEERRSLRQVYDDAESKRNIIESSFDGNRVTFQKNLLAAIQLYEECLDIADRISLFSPNESLEDIGTADLQYLLLDYRLAELILRIDGRVGRKANLQRASKAYARYLKQLDEYDILPTPDQSLFESWQESPSTFSISSLTDAAARRDAKIKRFKEEKALKQKLDRMKSNPSDLQHDEAAARESWMTEVHFCTHLAFAQLESIAQEMHILSLAPPTPPSDDGCPRPQDARERSRIGSGYSERLDAPDITARNNSALLDKSGKPLRPFTLTSRREEFRNGVFRPDHSLPTMSIDEYLEEERRRGGIVDGGGPQSGFKPEVDEDDYEAADREKMKAREWDKFVEANPKGSGNTLNRG